MSDQAVIQVNLKSPNETTAVTVPANGTVKDLRAVVCEKFSSSAEAVCLICNGKIMRDTEKFSDYSLKSESIVHLIIKNSQKKKPYLNIPTKEPVQKVQIQEKPQESTNMLRKFLSDASSSKSGNSNDFMSSTTQMVMNLPDEMLEDMLLNREPIKKLFEKYPHLRSSYTAKNFRKYLEMMANPVTREELLRKADGIMAQMQRNPEALEELDRLVSDSHMDEQFSGDKTSNVADNDVRPNTTGIPAPNPWESGDRTSGDLSKLSEIAQFDNYISTHVPSAQEFQEYKEAMKNPKIFKAIRDSSLGTQDIRSDALYFLTSLSSAMHKVYKEMHPQSGTTFPNEINQLPDIQNVDWSAKFEKQLVILKDMGFSNREVNIQALIFSNGNVEGAVDWIIRRF